MGILTRLRQIAGDQAPGFRSDGFTAFFRMITAELDDAYFQTVEEHLRELSFRRGVMVSAGLGQGYQGTDYVLRRPNPGQGLLQRITNSAPPSYTYRVPARDDNGLRALSELQDPGG